MTHASGAAATRKKVASTKEPKPAVSSQSEDRIRINVDFPRSLLDAVEEFRFGNKYPNRMPAILELIRRGLKAK